MSDQTITSLIEKLEGAEVGSRELDASIADLLLDPIIKPLSKVRQMRWPFLEGSGIADMTPPVTTSLDAALALAERVLPRWAWSAGQGDGEKAYARLDTPDGCDFEEAYAATPALALCAALLRAQSEARPTGEDSPAKEGEGGR